MYDGTSESPSNKGTACHSCKVPRLQCRTALRKVSSISFKPCDTACGVHDRISVSHDATDQLASSRTKLTEQFNSLDC